MNPAASSTINRIAELENASGRGRIREHDGKPTSEPPIVHKNEAKSSTSCSQIVPHTSPSALHLLKSAVQRVQQEERLAAEALPTPFIGVLRFGPGKAVPRKRISPSGKRPRHTNDRSFSEAWMLELLDKVDPEAINPLVAFAAALKDIPDEEKTGYYNTLRNAPDLIACESNPLIFLKFHSDNVEAAAQRFALFWQERYRIFGERAYLPMDSTGNGAMSRQDLIVYNSQYLFVLPRADVEESVVCYTPSLVDVDCKERMRCVFYTFFQVLKNPISSKTGFTAITVFDKIGMERAYGRKHPADLLRDAFPMRMKKIHAVLLLDSEHVTYFKQRSEPLFIQLYSCPLNTHFEGTKEEIANSLVSSGFRSATLPESVGGMLRYCDVEEAFTKQRQKETVEEIERMKMRKRLSATASDTSEAAYDLSATEADITRSDSDDSASRWKMRRRRQLNNEASKRKRRKIKQHEYDLEKQCAALREQNARLKSGNYQLQHLLIQAQKIVTVYEERILHPNRAIQNTNQLNSMISNENHQVVVQPSTTALSTPVPVTRLADAIGQPSDFSAHFLLSPEDPFNSNAVSLADVRLLPGGLYERPIQSDTIGQSETKTPDCERKARGP